MDRPFYPYVPLCDPSVVVDRETYVIKELPAMEQWTCVIVFDRSDHMWGERRLIHSYIIKQLKNYQETFIFINFVILCGFFSPF